MNIIYKQLDVSWNSRLSKLMATLLKSDLTSMDDLKTKVRNSAVKVCESFLKELKESVSIYSGTDADLNKDKSVGFLNMVDCIARYTMQTDSVILAGRHASINVMEFDKWVIKLLVKELTYVIILRNGETLVEFNRP